MSARLPAWLFQPRTSASRRVVAQRLRAGTCPVTARVSKTEKAAEK